MSGDSAGTGLSELASRIHSLVEELALRTPEDGLRESELTRARRSLEQARQGLSEVIKELDPVAEPGFVFDPSNPETMGRVIALALVAQPRRPLRELSPFYGAGVYALYYRGSFPAYAPLKGAEHPIYVGKADPQHSGARTFHEQGTRLHRRLSDHRKSILKASANLAVDDFEFRALVVQTGWQAAAEQYLITVFQPIWNNETGICYGIGKHGDSPKTRANTRSPWDTVHFGRDWAHRDASVPDARPAEQILSEVEAHFQRSPPFRTLEDVVNRFLRDMGAAG